MNNVNVKIVTTRKKEKNIRKKINGAIAFKTGYCRINFNKPIYIGTSISDLTKVIIQDFHYNYIKNKNGNKDEMLLTDTDRLMCKIDAENVCEDFCKDKDLFDFNNYPKNWKYYNKARNLIVDKKTNAACL